MRGLLAERSLTPERMDLEVLDTSSAADILRALERINAWLGGVRATLFHIKRYSKQWKPGERIRFVDWGTGGADLPRAIVRWGRKHGFQLEVVGVDSNPAVIAYARDACRDYPEISIVEESFLDVIPAKAGIQRLERHWAPASAGVTAVGYDYALSSLCLHHLTNPQIVSLLQLSDQTARRGMIMNDLKRSVLAWAWIWFLTRAGGSHPIVQNDGPLSVRRAFRPEELAALASEAGLSYLKADSLFPYRLTLAGEKHA